MVNRRPVGHTLVDLRLHRSADRTSSGWAGVGGSASVSDERLGDATGCPTGVWGALFQEAIRDVVWGRVG